MLPRLKSAAPEGAGEPAGSDELVGERRSVRPGAGDRRMKICVVTPWYAISGVPLAQLRFARALAERGHKVDLVIGQADPQLTIPDIRGVRILVLGKKNVRAMLGPLRAYLRRYKPDIVFSAEDHLNDLVLLAALSIGYKGKISGSSRVFPLDQTGHEAPYSAEPLTKRWAFKQLTAVLSRRADAWTCVSEDLAASYRELFGSEKFTCVHNIIIDEDSLARAREPVNHEWFNGGGTPVVVAAGTLTLRKGFNDLIRAIGHLHAEGRTVRLALLGEGPMREELDALARELAIADHVWFAGRVDNPLKYFAKAPVSALSSYSEGLPNALVESMMCGCVPVATDCPTGPREVLQDGAYGYLVPMHDPAALANGIAAALDRPISFDKLREGIKSFEAHAVIDRHFELLGVAA